MKRTFSINIICSDNVRNNVKFTEVRTINLKYYTVNVIRMIHRVTRNTHLLFVPLAT